MDNRTTAAFWNPRRFGQLLLRDAASGYRAWLIAAAAVGGVVILLSALTMLGFTHAGSSRTAGSSDFYTSFFFQILFLGGFIATSLAFQDVGQHGAGAFYMTLPASPFEKLASRLILTTIGYSVGVIVFSSAAAAVSEGINLLVFGSGHGLFNPFTAEAGKAVGLYMLVQSVFFLGSVWFRKLAFLKTILWFLIAVAAVAIVAGVTARIALAPRFTLAEVQGGAARVGGWSLDLDQAILAQKFAPGTRGGAGLAVFTVIGQVLFYGFLAPVCWVAAYFRLREIEV